MTEDLEVNRPEVVDEITLLFEAYEAALVDKNVEVLDNTFLGQRTHNPLRHARKRLRIC